jgi:cell division protein FtsL
MSAVTLERLERAIQIVAEVMVRHDRRGLIDTIHRLEDERERLRNETDPIAYAKGLWQEHNRVHNMTRSESA